VDEKVLASGETLRTGVDREAVRDRRGVVVKSTKDLAGTRGLLYFGFFDGGTADLDFI
jgi:hypothetical protein